MSDEKSWYQSEGVWGGVLAALLIMSMMGADLGAVTDAVLQVGALIGAIAAIRGRVVATKRIKR